MATCTPFQQVTTYQLTLTEYEAAVLLDVLMHVGGNPKNSPREHADSTMAALKKANVPRLLLPKTGTAVIRYEEYYNV